MPGSIRNEGFMRSASTPSIPFCSAARTALTTKSIAALRDNSPSTVCEASGQSTVPFCPDRACASLDYTSDEGRPAVCCRECRVASQKPPPQKYEGHLQPAANQWTDRHGHGPAAHPQPRDDRVVQILRDVCLSPWIDQSPTQGLKHCLSAERL